MRKSPMIPPAEFASLFAQAGWHAPRHVDPDAPVPTDHPGHEILRRFSGLHIFPAGISGLECPPSDIAFAYVAADSFVELWAARLGQRVIGVAHLMDGYAQLWVDSDYRFFMTNDIDDTFSFVASGFEECTRRLLSGVRVRPLLEPEKDRVEIYGDTVVAPDDRIYDWKDASDNNAMDSEPRSPGL